MSSLLRRGVAAIAVTSLVALAACSEDEEPRISTADAFTPPAAVGTDAPIEMIIYSSTGDTIVGVEVSDQVAESAVLIGPDDEPIESLQLPEDELFPIAPGTGYILLETVTRELVLGDRFEITLVMDDGDDAFIPIEVGEE